MECRSLITAAFAVTKKGKKGVSLVTTLELIHSKRSKHTPESLSE